MFHRKEGFTFLELAVVVVIIGIMMAVTAPRFSSTFSKATLGGTARALAGTMAYIRNAAAKEGRGYFLNIDLNKNEYWVTVFNEEADLSQTYNQYWDAPDEEIYKEVSDPFVSRKRLTKKIAFSRVILGDGTAVGDGAVRIEFRPDGTADETVIYLVNPQERVYTVYLEYYNGQASVYKYAFVPAPPPELIEREPPRRPSDAL